MSGADDWRLQGQERYLTGVALVRRRYKANPRNPSWDHDHCEFCSAKFELGPEPPVGYVTVDDYRWICETCFSDFHERFGWTLRPPTDT